MVIIKVTIVITHIKRLITLLITTHGTSKYGGEKGDLQLLIIGV